MFEKNDNEQFFRLFENVDVLFCLIGPDLYFKFLNKHWESVLGWTVEELKARPFMEFIHEDDVQRTLELAGDITENGTEVDSFVNRYKTKDGEYKWLEWFSITTHDDFFPAIAKDISQIKAKNIELEKAESRTQDLVENVPGVLLQYNLSTDGSEDFEFISPNCEKLFEYSAEQIRDDSSLLWNLVHKDDVELLTESVSESNRTLQQWEVEWRIHLPSGKRKYVRGIGKPRRLEDGSTLWNSFISDITKTKEQEEILKRMQRLDTIAHLTGGISHDLNNILNIIGSNCELISARNQNPNIQQSIDKIIRAIDRATSLTTRLMLTSHKNNLGNNERRSIHQCVTNVQELIAPICPKNISMNWSFDALAELSVIGDEFEDALTNLIINSINASGAVGTITIREKNAFPSDFDAYDYWQLKPEKSDQYYLLSVKDNGCGIKQADIEQVFTPFVTKNSRTTGSGLGLSMVLGFASRNGYGIGLNSTEGVGTEMSLWIPIIDTSAPAIGRAEQTGNSLKDSGKTIVIVDDEKEILETTHELLLLDGHRVMAFENASNAKDWISKNTNKIDLIITDEVMPGPIQGHHLAKEFKQQVPIIVMSGFIKTDDIASLDIPVYSKPIPLKALRAAIDENAR